MKLVYKDISFFSIIIAFSLMLAACSSTSLVNRWSDPEYKGPALQKILVIGVIKDDIQRRSFEEEFASLITGNGRTGIASYTLMPDLKSADQKEEVLAVVDKVGADGVMIVTLQGVSKEQRDVPPSVDYYPTAGMGMGYGMYGYYGMRHTAVYRPGYTVTDTVVRLDTKLFNAATEKMIWAGKTESFNPSSAQIVVSELAKLLISDMKKSGMVK
ncbi:MAG: hypothetical protein U9N50_01445 [Pseudomonadota bacterium]|nr:hypothetical protein [Pseudomonadota bacterium]